MSTSPEVTALEKLVGVPQTITVMVEGEAVEFLIKQIKTGKIPKLARAAGPLLHMFFIQKEKLNISDLVLFNTDDCLNILSVLTDQPREVIDELELDDAVKILTMCVEQNLDFFVQKVVPLLSAGMGRLAKDLTERRMSQSGLTAPNS
jgi:hypothetical protein